MPNTLAHLVIQAAGTKAVFRDADVKWILLGAVIPDIAFIIKRLATLVLPGADMLDVRLLAIPQASMVFGILLAFAFSRFSRASARVFAVLSLGVLLHLLLDACQTKWGNGPRFFAPIDWSYTNFGIFWPEDVVSHLLTLSGVVYLVYAFMRRSGGESSDLLQPGGSGLLAAFAGLLAYLLLPFAMMNAVEASGGGDVRLIRLADRTGEEILMDRARYRNGAGKYTIELYSGKFIALEGISETLPAAGKISVRGVFTQHATIRAAEYHVNHGRFRELASVVGLAGVALYWLLVFREMWRREKVHD